LIFNANQKVRTWLATNLWRRLFKLLESEVYVVQLVSLLLAVWPQQFFWLQHWHVAFWLAPQRVLAQPQVLLPLQVQPQQVFQSCKVLLLLSVLLQVPVQVCL
jgi:hypothetical protein